MYKLFEVCLCVCVKVRKHLGNLTCICHRFTVYCSLPLVQFRSFYITYWDNVDLSRHPYISALLVIT